MPDACPKCKSTGKCYRDPDLELGGYDLKCFACRFVIAWVADDGSEQPPAPPPYLVRPLLSTREYVTAELGPEFVPIVEELGLSTYDP